MARALFVLMIAPMAALSSASAEQAGGIQIAPVMIAMSARHSITSLRLGNGRDRAVAFEVDAYDWTQADGADTLTPTRDVIVSPGVFEIPAGGQQIVRLGVTARRPEAESAYRLVLRELPTPLPGANRLGFALELSLPVFVAPGNAQPALDARVVDRANGRALVVSNVGGAHAQIVSVASATGERLHAPRYLLAGATAEIALPADARAVVLSFADVRGQRTDRTVDVTPPARRSSGQ